LRPDNEAKHMKVFINTADLAATGLVVAAE
jgi:hypothetical protein